MEKHSLVKTEAVLKGVEGQREECVEDNQTDCPPVALEDETESVTSNPFAVFPHKVWDKIVRVLMQKNPEDAWNLIQTYPELREEVINKREVLFYKVLPLLFPDLDKSSVLACRQVCKSWRTIVDQFLEEHPSQKPYQPETSFLNETDYRYITLQDKNMEFMMKCLSSDLQDKLSVLEAAAVANISARLVVGRSASFFYKNEDHFLPIYYNEDMMTYYNFLCALLERIGSTIDTVSIPLTGEIHKSDAVEHYEGFARCLGLLQNGLKSLTVDSWHHVLSLRGNDNEARQQFIQLVQDFPLPELPNLKVLKLNSRFRLRLYTFSNYIPLQHISLHVLRTYGHQIEKLCLDPFPLETCTEVELGNLTDLQILGMMENRSVERIVELLQNVDAEKLQKIEIYDPRVLPMNRMFLMLERFQQLELFGIKMYKNYFPREDDKLPTFPNVRALKLDIADPSHWVEAKNPSDNPDSWFPGMFLLKAFPKLEYLEIRLLNEFFNYIDDMRIYQEDEIGTNLLRCKVYVGPERGEIEIWELFPRLKKFVVGNKRFEK